MGQPLDKKSSAQTGLQNQSQKSSMPEAADGPEAIYLKPRPSRPHPQHKLYRYLLKSLKIDRTKQVWAADITYIPISCGFMNQVVVMDWHNCKVLSIFSGASFNY
jgi:hypothetical protein